MWSGPWALCFIPFFERAIFLVHSIFLPKTQVYTLMTTIYGLNLDTKEL
jgi:hypothetical protein